MARASAVAEPLITVVNELKHVERFELDQVRRHSSRIAELANLSNAIADMAGGLAAFASTYPPTWSECCSARGSSRARAVRCER